MSQVYELPAGRELDCHVAERLLGYQRLTCDDYNAGTYAILWPPTMNLVGKASWRPAPDLPVGTQTVGTVGRYTTDIKDAWDVVERMARGGWHLILHDCPDGWSAIWLHEDIATQCKYAATGQPSAAVAICKAALLAIEPAAEGEGAT